MTFLLDTNVVSEVRKPAGNPRVKAWIASVRGIDRHISVLVVGEIRYGIERLRRRDPKQAGLYETWLGTLQLEYADRIIPITAEIAAEWGRLHAHRTLPIVDGLLAATAIVKGLVLVTRNSADIGDTGVRWLNPFEYAF